MSENIYYGEKTRRARENFHIAGLQISLEPKLIMALGYVKRRRLWPEIKSCTRLWRMSRSWSPRKSGMRFFPLVV